MIEHIVLFKLRPEADERCGEEILREARIRLLKVPCVRGLRCGHRVSPDVEWPLFLLVELENEEKIATFRASPPWVRFEQEVLAPHVSVRLEMDFQTNPGGDPLFT